MKRMLLVSLALIASVNFTLAQSDRLGLETASTQMASKIPVAVATTLEASSVPAALPGVLSYYFGYGRYRNEVYPTTQLGNELQPRVGDLMLQMGYANIIPQSGFQGVQGEAIRQETQIARVVPKYIVVPTISFEGVGTKSQSISLSAIAPLIGPVSNRVGRVARDEAARSSVNVGGQKVKATFALRFYDQSGTQIMIEEACAEDISVEDANLLRVGLTYGKEVKSVSTLKPLAVKLMSAMTARLLGKGACG